MWCIVVRESYGWRLIEEWDWRRTCVERVQELESDPTKGEWWRGLGMRVMHRSQVDADDQRRPIRSTHRERLRLAKQEAEGVYA